MFSQCIWMRFTLLSRTIGDYLGEALCTFVGDLITSQIEYQQRTIQPQALYRHEQHGITW